MARKRYRFARTPRSGDAFCGGHCGAACGVDGLHGGPPSADLAMQCIEPCYGYRILVKELDMIDVAGKVRVLSALAGFAKFKLCWAAATAYLKW